MVVSEIRFDRDSILSLRLHVMAPACMSHAAAELAGVSNGTAFSNQRELVKNHASLAVHSSSTDQANCPANPWISCPPSVDGSGISLLLVKFLPAHAADPAL